MNIPDNIINKNKYKKARKVADETYKRHSAYKSMYIQKVYKSLGGKYKTKKNKEQSTTKWLKEEWIQVIPYLTKGKKIICGKDNKKSKVCRPYKRIDKNTPITIKELEKMHTKHKLLKLAKAKNKNMDGRVFWKTGKFITKRGSPV
tara:strand:- start:175 stop:612 length:438 start_codon:yes stop_codon:yes gene_type:complete